ncbi:hypothetical protein LC593_10825 [Nostoc sp. CHAB 5844]|nr:hypothetical protein [Nostoc sp. CHAB 5844]
MYFLIQNNEIVGTSDAKIEELPLNFSLVEGPDILISQAYYKDGEILPKGSSPSPQHTWDEQTHTWIEPEALPVAQLSAPNWDALIASLENSPEWGKAYTAAERTLKANTAFTTLLTTLTSLRRTETLEFAIAKLREAMSGIAGIGDFTLEELASINQKLAAAGFDLVLSA